MASKSVAEWQNEIQKSDGGLVASAQSGDPAAMTVTGRLLWLRQVADELGLDFSFLAPADELREKAAALRTEGFVASQQAAQRRSEAFSTLGRTGATLKEAVELWAAQSPWVDVQPNHDRPPAIEIAENGARAIESGITPIVLGNGERIFSLAQKKAAEIVAEIAALPDMPKNLWATSDPAGELARWKGHRSTYGTLVSTHKDFWQCHQLADVVRDAAGYGVARFGDGAPRTALWLKNWRLELGDATFANMKPILRIRWAIDHDFGPGVWRPADVTPTTADDRRFGTKLNRFGKAVGVNI